MPIGGLVAVVNRGITEGWSQRFTIQVGRALDLSFRDTTFRNVWHQQEAEFQRVQSVLSHPPTTPLDPTHVSPSSWGKSGTYYYWVNLVKRVVGTGDLVDETLVTSSPELLSPDEIVEQMMATLADAETPNETPLGFTKLGAYVYAVTQNAVTA